MPRRRPKLPRPPSRRPALAPAAGMHFHPGGGGTLGGPATAWPAALREMVGEDPTRRLTIVNVVGGGAEPGPNWSLTACLNCGTDCWLSRETRERHRDQGLVTVPICRGCVNDLAELPTA